MKSIEIPGEYQRNSPNVLALGIENTGLALINRGNELLGCTDLSGKDVLDIGCGVRFTQTIINRELPVQSYTGIDIDEHLINYMSHHVKDSRFSFYYWNIYNAMYNTTAQKLTRTSRLPLAQDKKFDVVWMYSVITHNNPVDAEYLFRIARRYIRKDGALLFSAFIDNTIDTFEDRIKDQPLLKAYYNEKFLRKILSKAGWDVKTLYNKWADPVSQNLFLCKPKYHFWETISKHLFADQ